MFITTFTLNSFNKPGFVPVVEYYKRNFSRYPTVNTSGGDYDKTFYLYFNNEERWNKCTGKYRT